MRPARKGPENYLLPGRRGQPAAASMRPARKGPENAGAAAATTAPNIALQ